MKHTIECNAAGTTRVNPIKTPNPLTVNSQVNVLGPNRPKGHSHTFQASMQLSQEKFNNIKHQPATFRSNVIELSQEVG